MTVQRLNQRQRGAGDDASGNFAEEGDFSHNSFTWATLLRTAALPRRATSPRKATSPKVGDLARPSRAPQLRTASSLMKVIFCRRRPLAASLAKGGKFAEEGNFGTKSNYAKDGVFAKRAILPRSVSLPRAARSPRGQICQGWELCQGRRLRPRWPFCPGGQRR